MSSKFCNWRNSLQNLNLTYAKCFLGTQKDALIQTLNEMVERGLPCAVVLENLISYDFTKLTDTTFQENIWADLFDTKSKELLAKCLKNNVVLLCNYGNSSPELFVREIIKLATELSLSQPQIVIDDQDLMYQQTTHSESLEEWNKLFHQGNLVFNLQLKSGLDISKCLLSGAKIVFTKNFSYSSLMQGATMAHFDWSEINQNQLASTSIIAYLLNCELQAAHLTSDSEGASTHSDKLSTVEFFDDGSCIISRPDSEKGSLNAFIVKKLYEIEHPRNFVSQDIVADLEKLVVEDLGKNQVMLRGVKGRHFNIPSESSN